MYKHDLATTTIVKIDLKDAEIHNKTGRLV